MTGRTLDEQRKSEEDIETPLLLQVSCHLAPAIR